MNSVQIIGTIGKDIEVKYLPSGSCLASFSVAVNQDYKKDGQLVKKTSWFDVSAFGKTAENLKNYFHKGSRIGVSGELEQQTWTTNDGQNRSKVIIKLQSFTFIDRKQDNQQPQGQYQPQQQQYQPQVPQQQQYQQQAPQPQIQIQEDSIPF
jgi:single-strand DNA-binding protein